jgi:hypothetical protein
LRRSGRGGRKERASPPESDLLAGIRRALIILTSIAAPTAVFSALIALAAGTPVTDALATGFYIVGATIMIVGVLSGVRGPLRSVPVSDDPGSQLGLGFGPRRLRKATDEERRDAVSTAVLFLVLGFVLVTFGVVADSEVELY